LAARLPPFDAVALTMTGELADCFSTRAEGVCAILDACAQAFPERPEYVWETTGRFATPSDVRGQPLAAAAANWHALATFSGRMVPAGTALLVDVGSTTTDIVPLKRGVPCPAGLTDAERLKSGELVYTGARRTPLCAVAQSVECQGRPCRVAAELFATTLDIHLLLGNLAEDPEDCGAADGRPATILRAAERIARMLCSDAAELDRQAIAGLAAQFAHAQRQTIAAAITEVMARQPAECNAVVICGSGSFVARQVVQEHPATRTARLIDLASQFTAELSVAACAWACCQLASSLTTRARQG
jgi:hypothetical protein